MVCPVNVEGELVWGHLTYSCRLGLVCGAIGRGPQVTKSLNTERWISNFKNIGENCRVSEIVTPGKSTLLGTGAERGGCLPVM